MALVDPFGDLDQPIYAEGRCEGTVARGPRGESGFGYDPLFVVGGLGRTFAELTIAEKTKLSHRGKALAALFPHVEALVRARVDESKRILSRGGAAP